MRNASVAVLREIGVETGGSNVQFGINPKDGRMVVIEMNPRVSRSSALASKATGFPIAKIAAKLAVGYTLDELKNDITGGVTPASFEPSSTCGRTVSNCDPLVFSPLIFKPSIVTCLIWPLFTAATKSEYFIAVGLLRSLILLKIKIRTPSIISHNTAFLK